MVMVMGMVLVMVMVMVMFMVMFWVHLKLTKPVDNCITKEIFLLNVK